jgi:hypothetical protein
VRSQPTEEFAMTKQEFLRQGREIAARLEGKEREKIDKMLAEIDTLNEKMFEGLQEFELISSLFGLLKVLYRKCATN